MKSLIIALAVLVLPLCAIAQQSTITGQVADSTGHNPLPGAQVRIPGTARGAYTDAYGNFVLTHIEPGVYNLQVSYLGYTTKTIAFTAPLSSPVNVNLNHANVITDAVLVAATRVNNNQGVAYNTITQQDIGKTNLGQDLPFLLQYTPGVVSSSDAGNGVGYTGMRIRGSAQTRVNVTINGIAYNEGESQQAYLVDVSDLASSTNSIQIQRGVGTSTNGAAAFGGSVNIETESLNPEAYGELANSAGSFGTHKHTLKLGSGLLNNRFSFEGRLSNIRSDGYMDRAASNLKSYYLSGGYYGEKTLIKLIAFSGLERTYQAWNGVPQDLLERNRTFNEFTYRNQIDNFQQDHYQLHISHKFNPYLTANLAFHYTRGNGYYEEYKAGDDLSKYGISPIVLGAGTVLPDGTTLGADSAITNSDVVRRRWLRSNFYGATYSVNYTRNKVNLTVGGAANQYKGEHFGEVTWARYAHNVPIDNRYYSDNATKNDINVFAKLQYNIAPRLNAFVDVQYRNIFYSFLGFNRLLQNVQQSTRLNFFNPKGGLSYNLTTQTQLYASVAAGSKEATRDDYTNSTPQSRPKAEYMLDYEAGIRKQNRTTMLAANLFLMDYKDQLVLTGKINDVGEYIQTNVARSYRTGIELEAAKALTARLTVGANLSLSQNKVIDFVEYVDSSSEDYSEYKQVQNKFTKTDIAFSPNVIGAFNVNYKVFKGFTATLLGKYVARQYLDNTQNKARSLNPYFVNDVRFNYDITTKAVKQIQFSLLVNNIFNVLYESNGYTYSYITGTTQTTANYYFPQAGTNFLAGVTMRF